MRIERKENAIKVQDSDKNMKIPQHQCSKLESHWL